MNRTLKFILSYGAVTAGMHVLPGPWKNWKKKGTEPALDMWTATHVLWSMIAKKMGIPLYVLMGLAIANEGLEWYIRKNRPDLLWGSPENSSNVMVDLLANWVGYAL